MERLGRKWKKVFLITIILFLISMSGCLAREKTGADLDEIPKAEKENEIAEIDATDKMESEVIEASEGMTAISLGTPTEENQSILSGRNPADMIIEDGKLYIGGGDYTKNTGPTIIWCYDLEKMEWVESARVSEEAIQRFVRVEDKVMAPGIDPMEGWSKGNYYVLNSDEWMKERTVPNGVHMYDIVEFDGGKFYGIGTSSGLNSPVKLTRDDDTTFEDVLFIKDEKLLFGNEYEFFRVYDFYILNDELYCFCQASNQSSVALSAFFKYKDGAFYFVKDFDPEIGYTHRSQNRIYAEVAYEGNCYFVNGKLYKTADFMEIKHLQLPEKGSVNDLLVKYNDETGKEELFVLCDKKIYKYINDEKYDEICSFNMRAAAVCMEKDGNTFFVGLASGEIIQINCK